MESIYVIKLVEDRVKGLNTAFEIIKEVSNDLDWSEYEKERLELVKWLINNRFI